MIAPIKLVTPPTAEEAAKAKVIEMLEEALAEAKTGKFTEFVLILKRADDDWEERATPTRYMSEWIGKLEMLKFTWMLQHEEDRDE
jgi:hypothetical protein